MICNHFPIEVNISTVGTDVPMDLPDAWRSAWRSIDQAEGHPEGWFFVCIHNKSPGLVRGFCALSYLYLNRLVINLLVVGTLEGIPHYAVPAYVLGSIVLQLNSNDFG